MTGHRLNWKWLYHNFSKDVRVKLAGSIIQMCGVAAIVVGASLIYLPAGIILGGAGLLLIGLAVSK